MKNYNSPLAKIIVLDTKDIMIASIFASDPIAEGGKEDVQDVNGLDWWSW